MIVRVIKESKYFEIYNKIIKSLNIEPDVIDIFDDQITIYFKDKMSEFYNGEKIEHDYNKINKIESYFKLINNLYVNSILINRDTDDEFWIDDLYSYTYLVKLNEIRDFSLKELGI